MVWEKPIREKFIIWCQYIYPCMLIKLLGARAEESTITELVSYFNYSIEGKGFGRKIYLSAWEVDEKWANLKEGNA